MIKKVFLQLIFILFFVGCGGGSDSNTSNNNSNTNDSNLLHNVTSTLIDSTISGVSYSCNGKSGLTDINGQFSCEENSTVFFTIGGIKLGNIIINANNQYITPAKLYNLSSDNITDVKIINFVQLLQSLDSDKEPSNGIDINQTTREKFIGYILDISNENITEVDINNAVNFVGKNLISKNKALEHYINTLRNKLNIVLKDEPYYNQQWYLEHNNALYSQNNIDDNAHVNVGNLLRIYSGKGVKIAIIDDGLDTKHEDLNGAIINTFDITTKSTDVSHSNPKDYHGTAVTGIIGARVNGKGIQGIASNSDIIFLKYKEGMSDSETIELFNKAEEFGADIINCSWGTYDVSQSVKEKIQNLAINGRNGKGMIIVFAAGNDNKDMANDESSIPEVVAVGATDKNNRRAWYSNYGKNLDVMALGGYDLGITTLDPMNTNGISVYDNNYLLYNEYNSFIGTSASAPIISGIIAIILEKNPLLTRLDIENILKNSSDKIGDTIYENGRNNYYGFGKINLKNIMDILN